MTKNDQIDTIAAMVADFELKEHLYMELQKRDPENSSDPVVQEYRDELQTLASVGAWDDIDNIYWNTGIWTDDKGMSMADDLSKLWIDTYYDLCQIREEGLDEDDWASSASPVLGFSLPHLSGGDTKEFGSYVKD